MLSYIWYLNLVLCACELRSSGYEACSIGWGNGCYTYSKSGSCFQNTYAADKYRRLYVDTRMVQLIYPDACSKLLKLSWIRPLTCLSSELTFWTITSFGHLVRLRDGRSAHRKVCNYITEEHEHTLILREEFKPAIPRQGGSWSNIPWTTLTLPSLQH